MVNLSPNEETIVNLLSLDRMVNHSGEYWYHLNSNQYLQPINFIGSVFGLPQCESSPRETTLEHEYEADDEVGTENVENIGNNSHTNEVGNSSSYNIPNSSRKRRTAERKDDTERKHELLVEQTKYLKKMVENSSECARYARKMFKLKEDEVNRKEAYMLRKEKQRQEEIEYKMQLLRYKQRKLKLLERQEMKE